VQNILQVPQKPCQQFFTPNNPGKEDKTTKKKTTKNKNQPTKIAWNNAALFNFLTAKYIQREFNL